MILLLTGGLVFLVGFTLAINFKGIATKHVAMASRLVGPLSPFRRGVSAEKLAQRQVDQVRTERMVGALLALLGLWAIVSCLWQLTFG